jgi:hypothetical protein
MLPRWSPGLITDGGDLNLADSGEFAAKGNGKNPLIETFPPRFNPPGDPRCRSGAPGLDGEASGDLKRRRWTSAEARVSVGDEKNLGEEELGFLGLIHSGGTPFIGNRGRRSSSWASGGWRWTGHSPVLHRAAWSEMEDDGLERDGRRLFLFSNLSSNLPAGFWIWATYEVGLDVQYIMYCSNLTFMCIST